MEIFEDFKIRFEHPSWSNDLELGLIDSILEKHPHFISILGLGIYELRNRNTKGRKSWGRCRMRELEKIIGITIWALIPLSSAITNLFFLGITFIFFFSPLCRPSAIKFTRETCHKHHNVLN